MDFSEFPNRSDHRESSNPITEAGQISSAGVQMASLTRHGKPMALDIAIIMCIPSFTRVCNNRLYFSARALNKLQLCQHAHGQILRDLLAHRPFRRLGEVAFRVELADVARLELFRSEGRFFLHGFGVRGCEVEHVLWGVSERSSAGEGRPTRPI